MSALASDKGLILVLYMHSVLRMRKNFNQSVVIWISVS